MKKYDNRVRYTKCLAIFSLIVESIAAYYKKLFFSKAEPTTEKEKKVRV